MSEVDQVMRDQMRTILLTMFQGWKIRHDSLLKDELNPPEDYDKTDVEAATEAAGGDILIGNTLALIAYWDNDLISIAAYYGLDYVHDETTGEVTIRTDVPPAPSTMHYWSDGAWQEPPLADIADSPSEALESNAPPAAA